MKNIGIICAGDRELAPLSQYSDGRHKNHGSTIGKSSADALFFDAVIFMVNPLNVC